MQMRDHYLNDFILNCPKYDGVNQQYSENNINWALTKQE